MLVIFQSVTNEPTPQYRCPAHPARGEQRVVEQVEHIEVDPGANMRIDVTRRSAAPFTNLSAAADGVARDVRFTPEPLISLTRSRIRVNRNPIGSFSRRGGHGASAACPWNIRRSFCERA